MTSQQEQACINAYQQLSYWGVDFLDFVEFAEKLDKERKAYEKQIREDHEKLQKQLAKQQQPAKKTEAKQ